MNIEDLVKKGVETETSVKNGVLDVKIRYNNESTVSTLAAYSVYLFLVNWGRAVTLKNWGK